MKKEQNGNDYIPIKVALLKILIVLILGGLYYLGIEFFARTIYSDFLYVAPTVSRVLASFGFAIIIFVVMAFNKNLLKKIKSKNKITYLILSCSLIVIISPFLFLKSVTVADECSLRKINAFGTVTKEYKYEEITKCDFYDLVTKEGYQYEITFNNKDSFILRSQFNFKTEEDVLKFNQALSRYVKSVDESES